MGIRLATDHALDALPFVGPVHRSIVAVDLEGSTQRTDPDKGELRRVMYDLLYRALAAAAITAEHLEHPSDRGDGVLILIRPLDNMPKTVLLGQLIPMLTALLLEHNATVSEPALQLRLRAVVSAGEVNGDGRGFYGEDLDIAFRLLDSPRVKKALREAPGSPLVLVISEEIFAKVIRHGYVDSGPYEPLVRVQVAGRLHRGWVHIPMAGHSAASVLLRRANGSVSSPSLALASVNGLLPRALCPGTRCVPRADRPISSAGR
jgi:hypothetical protein